MNSLKKKKAMEPNDVEAPRDRQVAVVRQAVRPGKHQVVNHLRPLEPPPTHLELRQGLRLARLARTLDGILVLQLAGRLLEKAAGALGTQNRAVQSVPLRAMWRKLLRSGESVAEARLVQTARQSVCHTELLRLQTCLIRPLADLMGRQPLRLRGGSLRGVRRLATTGCQVSGIGRRRRLQGTIMDMDRRT